MITYVKYGQTRRVSIDEHGGLLAESQRRRPSSVCWNDPHENNKCIISCRDVPTLVFHCFSRTSHFVWIRAPCPVRAPDAGDGGYPSLARKVKGCFYTRFYSYKADVCCLCIGHVDIDSILWVNSETSLWRFLPSGAMLSDRFIVSWSSQRNKVRNEVE